MKVVGQMKMPSWKDYVPEGGVYVICWRCGAIALVNRSDEPTKIAVYPRINLFGDENNDIYVCTFYCPKCRVRWDVVFRPTSLWEKFMRRWNGDDKSSA